MARGFMLTSLALGRAVPNFLTWPPESPATKQGRWRSASCPTLPGSGLQRRRDASGTPGSAECCARRQSATRGEGRTTCSLKSAVLQLPLQTILENTVASHQAWKSAQPGDKIGLDTSSSFPGPAELFPIVRRTTTINYLPVPDTEPEAPCPAVRDIRNLPSRPIPPPSAVPGIQRSRSGQAPPPHLPWAPGGPHRRLAWAAPAAG